MGLMLAFQALRVRALRRKLLERWGACKFVASPAITGKGVAGQLPGSAQDLDLQVHSRKSQMISVRPARLSDKDTLFAIWLRAVRATHFFLSEADIDFYSGLVRTKYLPQAILWVAVDDADQPLGFMGMTEDKIDALFVAPEQHGKGVGRALVAYARGMAPKLSVDVNEPNEAARSFYTRMGFREVSRSERDDHGRAFPIFHLILED
jgi:putative acetyltransferase